MLQILYGNECLSCHVIFEVRIWYQVQSRIAGPSDHEIAAYFMTILTLTLLQTVIQSTEIGGLLCRNSDYV